MADTLYSHTDKDGDGLKVVSGTDGGDPLVGVSEIGLGTLYAVITMEQSVPFALAVLRAAGHTADGGTPVSIATAYLERAIREQEQAKDERLNEEAASLMQAYYLPTHYNWDQMSNNEKASWRSAALRARKVHEPRG